MLKWKTLLTTDGGEYLELKKFKTLKITVAPQLNFRPRCWKFKITLNKWMIKQDRILYNTIDDAKEAAISHLNDFLAKQVAFMEEKRREFTNMLKALEEKEIKKESGLNNLII